MRYPHTVLIISHDRGLLNRSVGAILHLEDRKLTLYQGPYDTFASVGAILHLEDRKLTLYQGPYDTFAETRAARLAVAEAENKRIEARRAHLQSFVDRFAGRICKALWTGSATRRPKRCRHNRG